VTDFNALLRLLSDVEFIIVGGDLEMIAELEQILGESQ
jgi:hypothetical protein